MNLRSLPLLLPLVHHGSPATLRDVVRHYPSIDPDRLHADGEQIVKPLDLDRHDVDALVAFLESLSAAAGR